jgi:hypothetical protein
MIFSLEESFSQSNPWHRIVGGLVPRGLRKMDDVLLATLFILMPGFLVAAGVMFWLARESPPTRWALLSQEFYSTSMYIALISVAFLAPSLGSAVRQKLDRSAFLPHALTAPIPFRAYAAAIHGRILWAALMAGVMFLLCGGPVLISWTLTDQTISRTLRYTALRFFLFALEPSYTSFPLSGGNLAAAWGLMLLMATSYAAGFYLRGTTMAALPQADPRAPHKGGALTATLLVLVVVTFALRWLIVYNAGLWGGPEHALMARWSALFVVEAVMLAVRLTMARRTWMKTLETMRDDYERYAPD